MDIAVVVEGPDGGAARPVMVDVDPDAPGRALLDALWRHIGGRGVCEHQVVLVRTGRAVDPDAEISSLELRHGDRLNVGVEATGRAGGPRVVRTPSTRGRTKRASAEAHPFELLLVGGPASGARFPLTVGEHVVGRSSDATITLADDTVSREHLLVSVSADAVEVSDLGSTNGSFLDGKPLEGTASLVPGQVVEVGSSMVTVEPVAAERRVAQHPYRDGRLLFNRPPRVTRPFAPPKFKLPVPPERPTKSKFPLGASVIPVALGVVMYLVIHQVIFLLFCAMGPAMAIWSLVDDRRSGRKEFRTASARFRVDLATLSERLELARGTALLARRDASPSPAHLVAQAKSLAPELWERRPDQSDFLRLRLGIGDLPSVVEIEGGEGGDEEMRTQADRLQSEHAVDRDVPVTVDLRDGGVVGLAGASAPCESLARWLVIQAVTLHSPRDLALVVLTTHERLAEWEWTRWLPHTEVLVPGLRSVAVDSEEARGLFEAVESLLDSRRDESDRRQAAATTRWSPHVLVLIPADVPVPRASLSKLLADGPALGVSAICVASTTETLPGETEAIVTAAGDELALTLAETGDLVDRVVTDAVDLETANGVAFALAAVRDVGAGGGTGDIPSRADLLDLLGLDEPTPDDIRGRWGIPGKGLSAPIGVASGGVASVDLVADGPHGLLAGTTGSGKSELLQTLVAALAEQHPPTRLNFVLVDYKGGAAFKDCVALPHTVGFFTDLDPHLAERALVSLNAELRHREEILRSADAKDLEELQRREPGLAPPSLVIVIDEFAFLKREVPDFVAGVVDIAQRGRSLGVHLLLATQRPSGVIDDNIRANTNLRIALRVNDDVESSDVIGRPDAARIPRAIPGRAYIRTGHSEVRPVQTAYVGGQSRGGSKTGEVRVRDFVFGFDQGNPTSEALVTSGSGPTDLQALVSAIRTEYERAAAPPLHPPWLPSLESAYDLGALPASESVDGAALHAVIGVVDEPAQQRQRPWTLDLDADGHVLVYGAGGTGKTTLLRTLAASLASQLLPRDLHLYGLDFAGRGLRAVEALPHCGGVVTADEIERTERLFAMVDALIDERKEVLGKIGAGSLAEYRRRSSAKESLPYIVVLLDGYGGFHSVFDQVDHGELLDRLARQVSEGRGVGVHFVITADRRSGIPTSLAGIISGRIVLRLADADEYAWLGLGTTAKDARLPPGRGFTPEGSELQIAVAGGDPAGEAQTAALASLGAKLGKRRKSIAVPRVELLPADVDLAALPAPESGSLRVPLGLDGLTVTPVFVDFDETPSFLAAGPDRTGRTTVLRTLVAGLRAANPHLESYLLSPRRSSLVEDADWTETARGHDACEALALRLAESVQARAAQGQEDPLLVVIDDGDELTDGKTAMALERIVRRGRDAGLILLAASQAYVVHRTFGGWLTEVRKAKQGLVLSPDVDVDGEIFGVKFPRKTVRSFPPGRGYLARRGSIVLVQAAQV